MNHNSSNPYKKIEPLLLLRSAFSLITEENQLTQYTYR